MGSCCSQRHVLHRDPDPAGSEDGAAFSLAGRTRVSPSLGALATNTLPRTTGSPKCAPGGIREGFSLGNFPQAPCTAQVGLAYRGETAARGPVPPNPVPTGLPAGDGDKTLPRVFLSQAATLVFPQSTRFPSCRLLGIGTDAGHSEVMQYGWWNRSCS